MRYLVAAVLLLSACTEDLIHPPGAILPLGSAKLTGRVSSSISARSLPQVLVAVAYPGGNPKGYSSTAAVSDSGGRYSLDLKIQATGALPPGDSLKVYLILVPAPNLYPTLRDSVLTTVRYTPGSGLAQTITIQDFTFPIP